MGKQRPSCEAITDADGTAAILVNATATVYSKSFMFLESEDFSLQYKATSDGTVNLLIELEIGLVPPTTEGSADTANFVVGESFGDIEAALADELVHIATIAPPLALYGRLKITGGEGNDATTTLTSYLVRQNER